MGSILELTGNSASSVFNVYGRLTLRGDGRVTDDAGNQTNVVNLMPGGNLRLDYNMDVNDNFIISRLENSNLGLATDENKWSDSQEMVLDGAGLNLINSSGRVNQETVGQITLKGGAGITLERNGTNGQIILITNTGLNRVGQSTLTIRENADELGSVNLQSMKMFINDPAWVASNTTNGILPVWMMNNTRNTFLRYNAGSGYGVAAPVRRRRPAEDRVADRRVARRAGREERREGEGREARTHGRPPA